MDACCLYEFLIEPILGVVIFLATLVPSIVINVVLNFLLSLLYLPYDLLLILKCVCFSPHFGLKLRIFGLLLFFPCAVIYPILILIGSIGIGMGIAAHCGIAVSITPLFSSTKDWAIEFEDILGHTIHEYCNKMMHPSEGAEVYVYDISLSLLFLCLFISLSACVILFLFGLILVLVYVIPGILRVMHEMLKLLSDNKMMIILFVPWMIMFLVLPFLIIILGFVFPLFLALLGLTAGISIYKTTFGKTIKGITEHMIYTEKTFRAHVFG